MAALMARFKAADLDGWVLCSAGCLLRHKQAQATQQRRQQPAAARCPAAG